MGSAARLRVPSRHGQAPERREREWTWVPTCERASVDAALGVASGPGAVSHQWCSPRIDSGIGRPSSRSRIGRPWCRNVQEDQFAALLGHGLPQPLEVLQPGIVGGADVLKVECDSTTVAPLQEENGATHQVSALHREMSARTDGPAVLVDDLREGGPTLTGTPLHGIHL